MIASSTTVSASESKDNTRSSSSNVDEDWTSLSATFDRAASKPGAFQGIMNRLDKVPATEPPVARRILVIDVAPDKEQWQEFLADTDLQNAPPASDAVRWCGVPFFNNGTSQSAPARRTLFNIGIFSCHLLYK